MFRRLRRGQPSKVTRKLKQALSYFGDSRPPTASSHGSQPSRKNSGRNSRPNSRHRRNHKTPKGFTAPVDKLLFLQNRVTQGQTEAAVLISSEAGYLHFWSVYGKQHDMGYFYASESKDEEESVLALCTNKENSLLISGDTMGYIYIWNIEQYCLQPKRDRQLEKPPLVCSWHAHDSALVSVDFVIYDDQTYILSASTDHTARLWTLIGHFVGTFGQTDKWVLKNPATWQHPKTPWAPLVTDTEEKPKVPEIIENGDDGSGKDEHGENGDENVDDIDGGVSPVPSPEGSPSPVDDLTSLPSIYPVTRVNDGMGAQLSPCTSPTQDKTRPVRSADTKRIQLQSAPAMNGFESRVSSGRFEKHAGGPNPDYNWRAKRSVTFANFGRAMQMKTLLGHRVEENIARRAYSRQERRHKFGDVDMALTSRFGKLCSPFQALATPATEEILLPGNLPMTPRMLNRGLTVTSEAELKEMSLSPQPEQNQEMRKDTYPLLPAINHSQSSTVGSR